MHEPADAAQDLAVPEGDDGKVEPSSAQEPEEEPVDTAPQKATHIPREAASVIDISESPSHTERFFDKAQAVIKKSDQGISSHR